MAMEQAPSYFLSFNPSGLLRLSLCWGFTFFVFGTERRLSSGLAPDA